MKNLTTAVVLTSFIAAGMSCSPSNQKESTGEAVTSTEVAQTSPEVTAITFRNDNTTKIVNGYLEVKDALVSSDAKAVKNAAERLSGLLSGQEGTSLTTIQEVSKEIAASNDLEQQRTAFDKLSSQLYELVKGEEVVQGNLYLQHCPMAKNNEGADWLSLSEEIRNPYFGNKMLKCGSVTEKI